MKIMKRIFVLLFGFLFGIIFLTSCDPVYNDGGKVVAVKKAKDGYVITLIYCHPAQDITVDFYTKTLYQVGDNVELRKVEK